MINNKKMKTSADFARLGGDRYRFSEGLLSPFKSLRNV